MRQVDKDPEDVEGQVRSEQVVALQQPPEEHAQEEACEVFGGVLEEEQRRDTVLVDRHPGGVRAALTHLGLNHNEA